jgi:hypothetical protein
MKNAFLTGALALVLGLALAAPSGAASSNGAGGTMSAYYDGQLFTINLMELKTDVSHNNSVNEIYESDAMPGGQMFVPVLDAIQGDGFNPLWEEVDITFNPGVTPVQYTSDTAIDAAVQAGQITLTHTHEIYRCSVIGKP